jgi:hypothetical protein
MDELIATTKSYLHHGANFFFLDNNVEVLAITTAWRALSMSGHTFQGLQRMKLIPSRTLYRLNWLLAHARNLYVLFILYQCYMEPDIRVSFGTLMYEQL